MSLRKFLTESHTSASSLAVRVGVGRMTISRILSGASCQTRILDKIAAATGLSREDLLPPSSVALPAARRRRRKRATR